MTVFVCAGLIAGCATAAQRQYSAMATGNRAAVQDLQACVAAVYASPEFAALRTHIALPADRPTLEQLSDPSRATDGEIRSLLDMHPKVQACREQLLSRLTASTPSFAAILATLFAKADDSLIELIGKRQTWGEHTRQTRDLAVEARSELTGDAERITAGLQQSHEAELARRQEAAQATADAFARYAQTQAIISRMNMPVMNCITMGIRPGFQTTSCQ